MVTDNILLLFSCVMLSIRLFPKAILCPVKPQTSKQKKFSDCSISKKNLVTKVKQNIDQNCQSSQRLILEFRSQSTDKKCYFIHTQWAHILRAQEQQLALRSVFDLQMQVLDCCFKL